MSIALVTGSNGFIGSHLVEYLLSKSFCVRCMVRKTSDLRWIEPLNVEYVYADLSDIEALEKATENMDYIFHLGGKTKSPNREGFFQANKFGTRNLVEAAMKTAPRLKRFIYISSQAAAGPSAGLIPRKESDPPSPVTWYGESKLAGEHVVMEYAHRLPVTIIRPPSVYGPRDTDVLEVFKAVHFHIKPILGFKNSYASFIYILDLIKGLYQAALSDITIGETYYLVSDTVVSWQKMNSVIAEAMQIHAFTVHIPVWFFGLIALTRELHTKLTGIPSILNWQKMNEFKEHFWICENVKAKAHFGFEPEFSLEKGIGLTLDWYQKHGWI